MKNKKVILLSTIFLVLAFSFYILTSHEDDESFDNFELSIEDSLLIYQSYLQEFESNQILVSCDTTIKYWENINTEEQFTTQEIICDTMFLYCDTLNGIVSCDTLYITKN